MPVRAPCPFTELPLSQPSDSSNNPKAERAAAELAWLDAYRPEIRKAWRKQGFREQTPIQAIVMPVVAEGRDAMVEAKTGSGKTLAYGLPLVHREPLQTEHPEVLIVAPTRELAEQVVAELLRSKGTLNRTVVPLTGGGGMDRQKETLDAGATIIVGTIGRIEALLKRKILRLDHIRTIVFDEVDELLHGGFSANLAALLALLPSNRQTLIFSATIPTEVETVARQFTRSAVRLRTSAAREAPAELGHRVLFTSVDDRLSNLVGYLRAEKPYQALIFCGTRHETEEVREGLVELGLEAEFLHGELSPNKRKQVLARVRSGELAVLVASDIAARGLDLPGVDLVVNYSLPTGSAAYLHRAGRTGRAGRPGIVLSLVIGQQHDVFEKLKGTFTFESVDVRAKGPVLHRPMITREERDLLHRTLPRPTRHWDEPKPEKKFEKPKPEEKSDRPRRPGQRDDRKPQQRDDRKPRDDRKTQQRDDRRPQQRDDRKPQQRDDRKPQQRDDRRPQQRDDRKPQQRDDRKPQQRDDRKPQRRR